MKPDPRPRALTIAITASLLSALACSGGGGGGGPGGGPGGGTAGPPPFTGPVSVPAGSPVTGLTRAPDGTVSGQYVLDLPGIGVVVTVPFSVKASSETAAVATFTYFSQTLRVDLTDRAHATVTSDAFKGGAVTGHGAAPTDQPSQAILSGLLPFEELQFAALELGCGQGLAPVELAALLVPWQLHLKYASTSPDLDVASSLSRANPICAYADFAGATADLLPPPVGKPPSGGLINLGNDDPLPSVVGFFPFDDVGALTAMVSASRVGLVPGINTDRGPCNSLCRGACGADCEPNNCSSNTGPWSCELDGAGANTCFKLVYTDYLCGIHPACIAHDRCYDACNTAFGCGTFMASACMHNTVSSCDSRVTDGYGYLQGLSWARGGGPYTDSAVFRYVAERVEDPTACPCNSCVAGDTLVTLADGRRAPISELAVGDALRTVDPDLGSAAPALIERVIVHQEGPYRLDRLTSSSGAELLVTANHPVWTLERGYTLVEALVVGDHLLELDPDGVARAEVLVSIVRAASETDVVYNLKTSRGSYVAADILVHNKCLAAGALVETPAGARPVEALRPGDEVYGQVGGRREVTRVSWVYEKSTVLERLPGRRLAPGLLVTTNHLVLTPAGAVSAGALPGPDEDAIGTVYDLATESGDYWAAGVLLRAAPSPGAAVP